MKYFRPFMMAAIIFSPRAAMACATCFGAPDAPQTQAANMAILFLFGVIAFVLSLVASFFLYLLRRSGRAVGGAPRSPGCDSESHAHE